MLSQSEEKNNSKEANKAVLTCKSTNKALIEPIMDIKCICELEDKQEKYNIVMDYKAVENNKKKSKKNAWESFV